MKNKISIICATRGRPHLMQRMWESAYNTAANKSALEMIWFIDDDDSPSLAKHLELKDKYNKNNMLCYVAPRYSIVLSHAINKCYELIVDPEYIFCAGDDIIFRDEDWDIVVIEAFEKYNDRILVAGGHDGCNEDLITHIFLHNNWIKAIGYVVPPFFRDMYVDTWMNEVAKGIGRLERLPIMIEHMHFSVGKGEYDKTSQERMTAAYKDDECARIFHNTKSIRLKEMEILRKYIDEYQK